VWTMDQERTRNQAQGPWTPGYAYLKRALD
jgi:hypothetical protein